MKSIVFLIMSMSGGGAERVLALLCRSLSDRGYEVTLIITHQRYAEAKLSLLSSDVKVISLEDEIQRSYENTKKLKMLKARFANKMHAYHSEEEYVVDKFRIRNYGKVEYLSKYFASHPQATAVSFMNHSMFLTLLSAGKSNRVILSERGDPQQCLSSKTNLAFITTMFEKADEMVLQSPDAMQWYRDNTNVKGKVIFNPITPGLPERYSGPRQKKIVDFCRISSQKNLHLLVGAFRLFSEKHPEYDLYIYGDAVGNGAEGYYDSVKQAVKESGCEQKIYILPEQQDIHNMVRDYAMFVSSSDFEGMSNSMLEAMAIGLPTVCTDCPIGGARAVIKDHENGILVPVGDVRALAQAMSEVAEHPDLAERLSANGTKIREELSVDKIVDQWVEIING